MNICVMVIISKDREHLPPKCSLIRFLVSTLHPHTLRGSTSLVYVTIG